MDCAHWFRAVVNVSKTVHNVASVVKGVVSMCVKVWVFPNWQTRGDFPQQLWDST